MAGAMSKVGNPSSVHDPGRRARRLVEEARSRVAAFVGAEPDGVVFTSGGTEANNLAILGFRHANVIVSAIEHDSVLSAAVNASHIPVTAAGVIDLAALSAMLANSANPCLVSVMLANNETGVIQPAAEVGILARAQGALFHCDAVQAAGKMPIDMTQLGAHILSLSAHKLGGPQGVGALIFAPGVDLTPVFYGGSQEGGLRPGTENVAGIVGFGVAVELSRNDKLQRIEALRDDIEAGVRKIAPQSSIFGAESHRLPNTVCLSMPDVSSETQVIALDLAGVAISAGAACSSGKVTRSHVLRAMKAPDADCAIRVSLGWASTGDDVARFIDAWGRFHRRVRKTSARRQYQRIEKNLIMAPHGQPE